MEKFISCDWGTSSFRLRLVEAATQAVLAEVKSQQGIAAIHTLWKSNESSDRFSFYLSVLSGHIATLETQYGQSLAGVTVVLSGMASSRIGMLELPYKEMPFNKDGSDFLIHAIPPSLNFNNGLLIISGVRSATDVMRGEETILAGCHTNNDEEEMLFIFPGTHSKHVTVKKGIVEDFRTYMTGEIFDLLANKSILSASVQNDFSLYTSEMELAFKKGVLEGSTTNILNSVFHVRTNQLFDQLDKGENYYFLSGLLIGAELKDIAGKKYTGIQLVSTENFLPLYTKAVEVIGVAGIQNQDADAALIKGQSLIFKQYNNADKK